MVTETYREAWDKVLHSEDVDLFAAREVAYQWHGGQDSALYSFASTDCTVHSESHRAALISDVECAIAATRLEPERFYPDWDSVDQFTRESHQSGTPSEDWGNPWDAGLESLENLLRAVKALPARES